MIPKNEVAYIHEAITEECQKSNRVVFNTRNDGPYIRYVYFIRFPDGVTKIGRTNLLIPRFKAHFAVFGEFDIICIIKTQSPIALEKQLHALCKNKRVRMREYFRLDDDDLQKIIQVAADLQCPPEKFEITKTVAISLPDSLVERMTEAIDGSRYRTVTHFVQVAIEGELER